MLEQKHKIKLSGILALVKATLRREAHREANTTGVMKQRLESIMHKTNRLNLKKELIEHLLDSSLIETPNGDVACVCCNKVFKYHAPKLVNKNDA